jgi:hypothetical protein
MGQYEFSEEEDETIFGLGASMQFVGIFTLIIGVSDLLRILFTSVVLIVAGAVALATLLLVSSVLQIVISGFTLAAGRSLIAIPRTQGNDMDHLMRAMHRMTTMFGLQIVVSVIALGFLGWFAVMVLS